MAELGRFVADVLMVITFVAAGVAALTWLQLWWTERETRETTEVQCGTCRSYARVVAWVNGQPTCERCALDETRRQEAA